MKLGLAHWKLSLGKAWLGVGLTKLGLVAYRAEPSKAWVRLDGDTLHIKDQGLRELGWACFLAVSVSLEFFSLLWPVLLFSRSVWVGCRLVLLGVGCGASVLSVIAPVGLLLLPFFSPTTFLVIGTWLENSITPFLRGFLHLSGCSFYSLLSPLVPLVWWAWWKVTVRDLWLLKVNHLIWWLMAEVRMSWESLRKTEEECSLFFCLRVLLFGCWGLGKGFVPLSIAPIGVTKLFEGRSFSWSWREIVLASICNCYKFLRVGGPLWSSPLVGMTAVGPEALKVSLDQLLI